MDKPTRIAAYASCLLALFGSAGLLTIALVTQSHDRAQLATQAAQGIWEVFLSLIALVWLIWGFGRKADHGEERNRSTTQRGMALRTKWAVAATGWVVALAIAILFCFGNGADIGAEDVRRFTVAIFYGGVGAISLTWGIWFWAARRG